MTFKFFKKAFLCGVKVSNELKSEIIQWDVNNWGKALDFWSNHLPAVSNGSAGGFGEREGGLSLWLALNGFSVECSDYKLAEELPLALHVKHDVTSSIDYSDQDITQINFPDNHFDVVMFKSVIGTLGTKERQQKALDELHRVLKPNGVLLFAENLESTRLHQFARNKFTNWGHRWRYLRYEEMDEMLLKFSEKSTTSTGFLGTFGRTEKQRKFLSHIDRLITPILPKSWRYIYIAACRK